MAHLIEAVTGTSPTDERTTACVKAERETAGVPCGVVDQTVVEQARRDMRYCLIVFTTMSPIFPLRKLEQPTGRTPGVSHALADGEYAKRREECERVAAELGIQTPVI